MHKPRTEAAKAANQAWRKKPRQFAPKSRLGCKTCKIRRIKCDQARPSCLKCTSTGRTCDGYADAGSPGSSHQSDSGAHKPEGGLVHRRRDTASQRQDLRLQNLGPLLVLPGTGAGQTEAMCFFEFISIKHLNEYSPSESWRQTLMFFSQTVPSVRHAAIALALVHRNYMGHDSGGGLAENAPLVHYNRAIQLLLDQEADDGAETTAITLLVCYLFTCFDQLAGNYVQALNHIRGGVELSRNAGVSSNNAAPADSKQSGLQTLMDQVTQQIERLDMQAVTFLVDWTPVAIQDKLSSHQLLPSGAAAAFQSFDDAADHLLILVARVMRLRTSRPPDQMPLSPLAYSVPRDLLCGQLETWSSLFERMLAQGQGCTSAADFDNASQRTSLLRLQYTTAWVYASSYGPGGEMEYDNYLPQFQRCMSLAGEVAAAHERYLGTRKPTFTSEIGLIPTLYIIGVKCRHPIVRRHALGFLRQQPMREAVWDSISAARVVERVIEIEEGGSGDGRVAQSSEEIAAWHRIENLSWFQHASGKAVGTVDITYTFYGREGEYTESLVLPDR